MLQFPVEAIRESVMNVIVHKDYSSGVSIQISMFSAYITFWNFGLLPEDWTTDICKISVIWAMSSTSKTRKARCKFPCLSAGTGHKSCWKGGKPTQQQVAGMKSKLGVEFSGHVWSGVQGKSLTRCRRRALSQHRESDVFSFPLPCSPIFLSFAR